MKPPWQPGVFRWSVITIACLYAFAAILFTGCNAGSTSAPTSATTSPSEQSISLDMPPTGEIISGTTKVNAQATPGEIELTKSLACPKLDSQLNQLLTAEDPLVTARQLNLPIQDQRIQVVIVTKSQDTAFLQEYNVEIVRKSGCELQAFINPYYLCELSNRDEVLAIRLPAAGVAP
jgi:hypothetical protein